MSHTRRLIACALAVALTLSLRSEANAADFVVRVYQRSNGIELISYETISVDAGALNVTNPQEGIFRGTLASGAQKFVISSAVTGESVVVENINGAASVEQVINVCLPGISPAPGRNLVKAAVKAQGKGVTGGVIRGTVSDLMDNARVVEGVRVDAYREAGTTLIPVTIRDTTTNFQGFFELTIDQTKLEPDFTTIVLVFRRGQVTATYRGINGAAGVDVPDQRLDILIARPN